jgi:hypothetical protein
MATERIDFRTFDEVEFSRTRATDVRAGYEHDRVLVYLRQLDWFLVIDAIRLLAEGPYTVSNLFYTHEVTARGETWFDTRLGAMRGYEPAAGRDRRLLIAFLGREDAWQGTEPVRRYYQDEILVQQSTSGRASKGMWQVFATALVPHDGGEDAAALAGRVTIPSVSRASAAAVRVQGPGGDITVGVKLDLEEAVRFADVRPRYDWASGRTRYGDWETDANFLYGRRQGDELSWAWTEATRLELDGRELFQGQEGAFPLQYTQPETRHAVTRWRAWQARQTL